MGEIHCLTLFSFSQPVYLKGEKYLLKGQIIIDSSAVQLPKDIIVDIINNDGNAIDITTATLLAAGYEDKTAATYEYSIWAKVGDKITFMPRDSRFHILNVSSSGKCVRFSCLLDSVRLNYL